MTTGDGDEEVGGKEELDAVSKGDDAGAGGKRSGGSRRSRIGWVSDRGRIYGEKKRCTAKKREPNAEARQGNN